MTLQREPFRFEIDNYTLLQARPTVTSTLTAHLYVNPYVTTSQDLHRYTRVIASRRKTGDIKEFFRPLKILLAQCPNGAAADRNDDRHYRASAIKMYKQNRAAYQSKPPRRRYRLICLYPPPGQWLLPLYVRIDGCKGRTTADQPGNRYGSIWVTSSKGDAYGFSYDFLRTQTRDPSAPVQGIKKNIYTAVGDFSMATTFCTYLLDAATRDSSGPIRGPPSVL